MTDLTEARKALERLSNELHDMFLSGGGVFNSAKELRPHIPAILQCLQAAEKAQALRDEQGALPKVSAW